MEPPQPANVESTEKPTKSNVHTKMSRKRKRPIEEVIAELPPLESVKFHPILPASRDPILNIPANINISSPYALFTLFFSEESLQNISDSTNLYAKLKKNARDTDDEAPELSEIEENEEAQDIEISEISIFSKPSIQQYSWKNTNPVEIKVFIGILLYMEVDWWYKVEPLATEFHMACRKYYTPGSKISIDEIMVKCFGRSQHTYKMPNKPIPRGYKIFGLAEHGYLWTFFWSSRRQGIMPMFQFPTLTKTGSMVVNLVNRLPTVSTLNTPNATPNATPNTDPNITPNITPNINPNTTPNINPPNATPNATPNQISIAQPVTSYSIYMDNYFTSVPLFKELCQQGYGACGTTRPNQVPAVLGEL
ncbi:predicted protein [Histoplasma mississippiense (nom. inval.)]|uniref:predicted protein n=1 Tax=Ajellomyces capsulatus (strain NAm1 / WU24) TaxID=2059318 RepID=UPI000157BE33|nr:predicted protein [Histoplasma mississippiense (nom. inval.)]EDN06697.1 predicted protein [Histoplasma mississippiense (nom. inval.)]